MQFSLLLLFDWVNEAHGALKIEAMLSCYETRCLKCGASNIKILLIRAVKLWLSDEENAFLFKNTASGFDASC